MQTTIPGRPHHQAPADRRRYPRHPLDLPVRFRSEMLDFQAKARFLDGTIGDISRTGIFVRSEFFEMPGTPVRLMVKVPDDATTLHLDGHVAWIVDQPPKGPGMGIELAGRPLDPQLFHRLLPKDPEA